MRDSVTRIDLPLAMLAGLTHRCPLACPCCSNPLELTARQGEMGTATWARIFREAADPGILQLHLSGGEPASRPDLVQLVREARGDGHYTNLITSGIGLNGRRLDELDAAGLDHIQLSLQGTTPEVADFVGGYQGGFARKMQTAAEIARIGFPMTINAVMHRHNPGDLPATLALAAELGARRIELACVQFQGWALKNRAALQPTRAQVDEARRVVAEARRTYAGRLAIDFVPPDYFADFPKACMNGWGSTGLIIAPDGKVLPCHAAEIIPGLRFQSAQDRPLAEIWGGPAFSPFAAPTGCPNPARAVSGARSIMAAAAARRWDCRRCADDRAGLPPPPFRYRRIAPSPAAPAVSPAEG